MANFIIQKRDGDMREGEGKITEKTSGTEIRCLEVLVSRSHIVKSGSNLVWALSVYSLENQPVKKDRAFHNSEIFHFMEYDWERTIRRLLESHQVPFSIIQFFSTDSVFPGAVNREVITPDNEAAFLDAIENLPGNVVSTSEKDADWKLQENIR